MPRLMSVTLTVPQVRDCSKTVTRRDGWRMLKPGDPLTLCEKVRGRKPGEPLVRIADVTVVSVRREPLNAITAEDVAAEGFPGWTPEKFVSFFTSTHKGCVPGTVITRIQWRYTPPDSAADAPDRETPACCPETGAEVSVWLKRSFWDLTGTVPIGGREFRSLYLEEARALGYADSDPAILLRREDDGTVFEVAVAVTARVVCRSPVPLFPQEVRAAPGPGGDDGD